MKKKLIIAAMAMFIVIGSTNAGFAAVALKKGDCKGTPFAGIMEKVQHYIMDKINPETGGLPEWGMPDIGKPAVPIVPTAPTEPADPIVPTTPVTPSKPASPTKPESPTAPTAPAQPSAPTQPSEPAPTQPAQPTVPPDTTAAPTAPAAPAQPSTPTQPSEPTPAQPTDPTVSASQNTMAAQVVALTNRERQSAGLSTLKSDSRLTKLAQMKAEDMAENNYFAHTSPTYGSAFDMMNAYGVSYKTAGENIAKGQKTAESVMTGWMNSSGHRANILNSSYTEIGVGYARDKKGTTYWVQIFKG